MILRREKRRKKNHVMINGSDASLMKLTKLRKRPRWQTAEFVFPASCLLYSQCLKTMKQETTLVMNDTYTTMSNTYHIGKF